MYKVFPPIKPRDDPKLKFKVSIVMGYMQNELNKCSHIIRQKKKKKKNKIPFVTASPAVTDAVLRTNPIETSG